MLTGEPNRARSPGFTRSIKVTSALLGAGLGVAAYARFVEPRTLLVRSFDLALPALTEELDGALIAFISDFHLGGPGDCLPVVDEALDVLENERPDVILLGGDFYDKGVRTGPEPDWSRFPSIAPTFAVPGNHDYKGDHGDADRIFQTLSDAGITVMRDEVQQVALRGGGIDLIGVDDPYTNRSDFAGAERNVNTGSRPKILLAHAGMIADDLPVGSVDLILSGHTHGAQIRVSPFNQAGPLDIFWWLDRIKGKRLSPYRQGLFWVRGSLLYVGNGIGMTSFGFRMLAPPEIALFRMRHGTGRQDLPCDSVERYVLESNLSRVWASKRD